MRKATSTVTVDPNKATFTIVAIDLETVDTIAVANPLKPPYQGNHQKRRCTEEKVNDKANAQNMRETTMRPAPQSRRDV
ncbi:hypothetical protein GBA52_014243 [Prunus armeniaca]|nr:hypothetical protein GBA52_014243 [Prunus armeniaca]